MQPLLDIKNISTAYRVNQELRKVLNNVSLHVHAGECVGVIGESGSGKTTFADVVLNILHHKNGKVLEGTVEFNGINLFEKSAEIIGSKITYIPQDPGSSLDPLFPIATNFREIIGVQGRGTPSRTVKEHIAQALADVHLAADTVNINSYPHQLSGGMQQRILIALALLSNPVLIIADEPTSNLDVTTERAIIALFNEIRSAHNVAFVLTTHNLLLARYFCDRIYVFLNGTVVETATSKELFAEPRHAYTQAVIEALPRVDKRHTPQAKDVKKYKNANLGTAQPRYQKISDTHFVLI